MDGTIKTILADKGCGFITTAVGRGTPKKDYFFHKSALKAGAKFEDLVVGQPVTFEDAEGERGPRAEDVYIA